MKKLSKFTFTTAAALLAAVIISGVLIGNLDLIKINLNFLEHIKKNKVDDILFSCFLIIVGMIIDFTMAKRRERRDAELLAQKLHVLKATMRTVQDIVNNFLNNFQLFRLEAEGAVSPESLALFDELIQETAAKLKALSDLEIVREKSLGTGPGIDYQQRRVAGAGSDTLELLIDRAAQADVKLLVGI